MIPQNPKTQLTATLKEGDQVFQLTYKQNQVRIDEFFVAPNLEEAKKLGREYCDTFNKRFIFVNPLIRDLRKAIDNRNSPNENMADISGTVLATSVTEK